MNARRALLVSGASIALALSSWLSAGYALDAYGSGAAEKDGYAAIVVAGAGVMPGGVPSDALVERTRVAVSLWRDGFAPKIAFTGGIGDWGPAESVVGAGLATEAGVPAEAIVREERSTSTEENAIEAAEVLGDVPILVVTDRYHVLRCERVFGRHFTRVRVVGVVSPLYVRVRGALREVLATAWYTWRGRM